jgi:hypothetical protein
MNRTALSAVFVSCLSLIGTAHAQSSYSTALQLEGLEAIRSSADNVFGAPPAVTGQWFTPLVQAKVDFKSGQDSFEGDNYRGILTDSDVSRTGEILPDYRYGNGMHFDVDGSHGAAEIQGKVLRTNAQVEAGGHAQGLTQWNGNFTLNAHSSFTINAISTMSATGTASLGPLVFAEDFNLSTGFLTLSLSGAGGQLTNSLGLGFNPTYGATPTGLNFRDALSYQFDDANKTLSITFTNNSDIGWTGLLRAGSSLDTSLATSAATISSAVPEPATYASMLLGLGLLGAMAKRRQRKNSGNA